MRSILHILVGWVVLAVGLAALTRHVMEHPEQRLRPVKLLTYPLDTDRPLRFQLDPGSRAVRLMSWRAAPAEWLSDPRVTTAYCLQATLLTADGALRSTWTRWISSRRSIGGVPDHPELSAAWLPSLEQPVSDDRQTILQLPEDRQAGEVLEVRRCDPERSDQLFLVVHGSMERNAAVQARMIRADENSVSEGALARYSDREWLDLPEDWRSNLVEERWARLAVVEGMESVSTTEMHTTFQRSAWRSALELGVAVPPGGALAYNLEGNTRLHFAWLEADGTPVEVPNTHLRVVHGNGDIETLPPDAWEPSGAEAGEVRSVQVGLPPGFPRPLRLQAWTVGGGIDRAWGDPPREPIDPETDRQWLAPDFRNVELARAVPAEAGRPVRFSVEGGNEQLRLRFIVPLPPTPPGLATEVAEAVAGPTVELEALDAEGTVLETHQHGLMVQPSVFERYTQVDTPASAAASMPVDVYYAPPVGAVSLAVRASEPVDVQLKVRSGLEELRDIPWDGYRRSTTTAARRRFVPLLRSIWMVRAPRDVEALLRTDRLPRVDLQVRLEEPQEVDDEGLSLVKKWHVLPLKVHGDEGLERYPMELLAEVDRDGLPNAGSRVRLSTGRGVVHVPQTGRMTLEYVLKPSRLGKEVTLRVGGEPHRFTPRTTTGRITLHGLLPGKQEVRFDPPAGPKWNPPEFWLARGVWGWPLWNLRRVRALPTGRELELVTLPGGPGWVRLFVYGASDLARLRWRLEMPGEDEANTGVWSWGDKVHRSGEEALKAAAGRGWLISQGSRYRKLSQSVNIRLPDDLPAGSSLYVSILNSHGPVHVRALASWPSETEEAIRLWGMDTPEEER